MPTYEYFYTVSAYTDYKTYLLDTGGTATQSLYASLYEDPSFLNGQWSHKETKGSLLTPLDPPAIYTGPATESAPYATTIKVKKNFAITYLVKFYLKVTDSPTFNGIYFLNDDCITDVKFTPVDATNTKQLSTATHNSGETFFQLGSYPGVVVTGTASSGTGYSTIYSIIKKSFKMGPAFTVTAKVMPQNYQTPSGGTPHPSATQVTITNAMIKGMNPGINCTDAVVQNNPPNSFTGSLAARGATFPAGSNYYNFTYSYAYDTCTKDPKKIWTGVKWFVYKATSGTYKGKTVIRYARIFADKDGNVTNTKPLEVSAAKNGTTDATGTNGFYMNPSLEKILEGIVAAKLGNCGKEVEEDGSGDPDEESAILVRPEQPKDALRWNPPPHVDARGVDYVTRANINNNAFFTSDGSQLDASAFRNIVNTYIGTRPERGRIFQDAITAKVMNIEKISKKTQNGNALQWGFRFMYNPEMISYENSDNSGVDWTYGSRDKSILLAGSQTFNFDLLINRIPDMSYLQVMRNSPQTWNQLSLSQPSIPSVYGRFLETYEIDGILTRGTEYDIEFLYRVLTGDPLPNSLLLEKGSTQLTADIGYTTKVPVWLFLNENMRLFGSVSSISVVHRIFDQNMVPMLSRLSIGFTRYPAYEGKSPNTGKEYKSSTDTKSTTGTTGG
jgi:hypothetical protein